LSTRREWRNKKESGKLVAQKDGPPPPPPPDHPPENFEQANKTPPGVVFSNTRGFAKKTV